MDKEKRQALEAAGFRIGDAEDFLELNEVERTLLHLRMALSRAVRQRRESQNLTQKQLAAKMKSSQSRVAKIETGAADVSLDLLFRGLFTVGGDLNDVIGLVGANPRREETRRTAASKPPVPKGTPKV